MAKKHTVKAPLSHRVVIFTLWPILAPIILVLVAVVFVVVWPFLLTHLAYTHKTENRYFRTGWGYGRPGDGPR